jgi:RNA polymerase sigma-70 factor (ECF subfamily)
MINSNLKDSQLVNFYINGEEKALEYLITRHKERLFNFIYSKVQDYELSNDIFQDTFIKVINTLKKGNYNEEGKFISWVMRIAHNLVIDHFRKDSKMPKYQGSEDFDVFSTLKDKSDGVEKQLINYQIEHDLHILIEKLPEEQKEVLKMRHFSDMSFKEIADNTNVSINTALGRMRYALLNLKKLIEENNMIMHYQ